MKSDVTLLVSWIICFIFAGGSQLGEGRTVEEWKSRVIYQLMVDRFATSDVDPTQPCSDLSTWCNGTWNGITRHLDYIKNLGANAIWISPIVENNAHSYHGYSAQNIFEVNKRFGSVEDLHRLVEECHARDIWVMVDVVPNHMACPPGCFQPSCDPEQRENFSEFTPFNETVHYHEYCEVDDWNNQTQVETCRLACLTDLNQTVPFVRQTLLNWITDITAVYGFDGYRVDTVKHVALDFWPEYQQAAGSYCLGEVWYEDSVDYLTQYQGPNGLNAVFNFHLFKSLKRVFQWNEPMNVLVDSIQEERSKFFDYKALGIFVDNHDMERFLHATPDVTLFKNSLTYVMFGEGVPVIYYGSEQAYHGGNDPYCRESLWPNYNEESEMYRFIQGNLQFRLDHSVEISSSDQHELFVSANSLVFARAENKLLVVLNNLGSSGSDSLYFPVLIPEGTVYVNILDESDIIAVQQGYLLINLPTGSPKVYVDSRAVWNDI